MILNIEERKKLEKEYNNYVIIYINKGTVFADVYNNSAAVLHEVKGYKVVKFDDEYKTGFPKNNYKRITDELLGQGYNVLVIKDGNVNEPEIYTTNIQEEKIVYKENNELTLDFVEEYAENDEESGEDEFLTSEQNKLKNIAKNEFCSSNINKTVEDKNMSYYTATYSNIYNNFVFINVPKELNYNYTISKESSIISIAKNMLLSSRRVNAFEYVKNIFKNRNIENFKNDLYETTYSYKEQENDNKVILFNDKKIEWFKTIKGNEDGFNPAYKFYSEVLPNFLNNYSILSGRDYRFIQELILPETSFNKILNREKDEKYCNLYVDFYLPQIKLVIEIDGSQHLSFTGQMSDIDRDKLFEKNGVKTIRIPAREIDINSNLLKEQLTVMMKMIEQSSLLDEYVFAYSHKNKVNFDKIFMDEVLRFEILLLDILKNERFFKANKLQINIISLDDELIDAIEIAYGQIQEILNNLFVLADIDNKLPKLEVIMSNSYEPKCINVDFDMFKKYDENERNNGEFANVIYVRNAYLDNIDYFKLDIAEKITYNFIENRQAKEEALRYFLRNVFKYDDYKNGQMEIIENALSGETTIGILPTGTGKSLCYQMCALLEPCVSFSVAPIQSLIVDQKKNLDEFGYDRTDYIISTKHASEKEIILNNFGEGRYLMIWISPERFQSYKFRKQLKEVNKKGNYGFAIIDEVHCLSEWGHDFRTSYLNLIKTIKKYCPQIVLVGLTATASQFVLNDLKNEFDTDDRSIVALSSMGRDELIFHVVKTSNVDISVLSNNDDIDEDAPELVSNLYKEINENAEKVEYEYTPEEIMQGQISDILKVEYKKINERMKSGKEKTAGLIFEIFAGDCVKREEEVWNSVKKYYDDNKMTEHIGIFNGKLASDIKMKSQKRFLNNDYDLLIATKAFGMGINKRNIKFTIHDGLPGSLESFYQEAGRAGRDENKTEKSHCYILYSPEHMSCNSLFEIDSTYEDIAKIAKTLKGDLSKIFYLYTASHTSIKVQLARIMQTYAKIFSDDYSIECQYTDIDNYKEIGGNYYDKYESDYTEECIYKLSLLGIINDWIVNGWDNPKLFGVMYNIVDSEKVKDNLIKYISKYDIEFSFDNMLEGKGAYKNYKNLLNYNDILYDRIYEEVRNIQPNLTLDKTEFKKIASYIRVLLKWQEDNILYNKRQNIKTMKDLCDKYKNGLELKNAIDNYFAYTGSTKSLDAIVHLTSNDFYKWVEVLLNKPKKSVANLKEYKDFSLVDDNELNRLNMTIVRYLESYRFNIPLNYLCGTVRILLNEFDNEAKERYDTVFEKLMEENVDYVRDVIFKTAFIIKQYGKERYNIYSEYINNKYPTLAKELYKILEDEYSLYTYITSAIDATNNKIEEVFK